MSHWSVGKGHGLVAFTSIENQSNGERNCFTIITSCCFRVSFTRWLFLKLQLGLQCFCLIIPSTCSRLKRRWLTQVGLGNDKGKLYTDKWKNQLLQKMTFKCLFQHLIVIVCLLNSKTSYGPRALPIHSLNQKNPDRFNSGLSCPLFFAFYWIKAIIPFTCSLPMIYIFMCQSH